MTSNSPQHPTMACVARVHSQATHYTDVHVSQLHKRVSAMQAALHHQSEEQERKRLRLKLLDRLAFLLIGSIAGAMLAHMVLPGIAVFILGLCPDAAREVFEFFKRL